MYREIHVAYSIVLAYGQKMILTNWFCKLEEVSQLIQEASCPWFEPPLDSTNLKHRMGTQLVNFYVTLTDELCVWAEWSSFVITVLSFTKPQTRNSIEHLTSQLHSWSFWIQCTHSVAWRLLQKQEIVYFFLSFDIWCVLSSTKHLHAQFLKGMCSVYIF